MENTTATAYNPSANERTKFCKHCGGKIPEAAVVCVLCGCQVEEVKSAAQPNVVINNTNTNTNTNQNYAGTFGMRPKNKWVAFLLCLTLGYWGAHKFYEGRIVLGLIYLFTFGLFGIGWFIDCVALLLKPNPYFPR